MARARLDATAVVDAAAALADAEGLQALTLSRLAAELGVRSPSLYAHVDGLEDLRRRLGTRGARELAAVLSRAAAGRAGGDALAGVAHAYLAYGREHPGSYAAAQRARELQDDDDARAAAGAVADVVLAVLRGYDLHGDDAVHAARVIRVALHGFVALEAEGGFAIALPLDATFERLIETLDKGLRGTPSPAVTRPTTKKRNGVR
jgi:AcrR family transcriptional regulator